MSAAGQEYFLVEKKRRIHLYICALGKSLGTD